MNHLKQILYKAEKHYYTNFMSANESNKKASPFWKVSSTRKKFTNTIKVQIKWRDCYYR